MFSHDITEYSLYKWRYLIGYGLVVVGLIIALVFAGLFLPGGISNQEMQSAVASNSIGFSNLNSFFIANLPYHILQKISFELFGVSVLSIKLPSIIIATLSAVGMVLLLRQWFKPGIGVLASLIATTTGQFLFIAQNGTPDVMYLFWSVWLILLAFWVTYQAKKKMLFVIIFCIAASLSMYTPLSIYILIALSCAILLHPHLRYLFKQIPRPWMIGGLSAFFVLDLPILIAVFRKPSLIMDLIGVPTQTVNFSDNLLSIGVQYLGFSRPGEATLMTPFFELGSMLIIMFGVFYILRTRASVKSYVISLWILFLSPIILANPDFTAITFLPLVILLATGLGRLLTYWYRIFPRNPYARVGGLIPIVILTLALVISGVNRYVYGYRYDPNIVNSFSKDLKLIPKNTKYILVSNEEMAFYSVLVDHNKNMSLLSTPSGEEFLATQKAKNTFAGYRVERIIATSNKNNANRFYLYKKIAN